MHEARIRYIIHNEITNMLGYTCTTDAGIRNKCHRTQHVVCVLCRVGFSAAKDSADCYLPRTSLTL